MSQENTSKKAGSEAELLLDKIGTMSTLFMQPNISFQEKFDGALKIIRNIMKFDVSIFFKVLNEIDNLLILEVAQIHDPENLRKDLSPKKRVVINLDRPNPEFINEVKAYRTKNISTINVPGAGSDMVGFVYIPEDLGQGYLFCGDFIGDHAQVTPSELKSFEIMCNLISSIIMRSHFEVLATHDGLTGLFNSRYIRQELEKSIMRYGRNKDIEVSVVLCDIDFFKKVNDTYGHLQGDVVLKEVGSLLNSQIRKNFDVIGRYGGEEFLVIMEGVDKKGAAVIVERWRKDIEEFSFTKIDDEGKALPDEKLKLTMSFGVAEIDSDADTMAEVLTAADKALYQSKENGRNKVTIWEDKTEGVV